MPSKKNKLYSYIQNWHDYVDKEPSKHNDDIKSLKKYIEKLLKKKTVWYDHTDVADFESYASMMRHKEGRWAGLPIELSIEQKYIVACVLGIKTYDKELKMEVRYFREMVLFVARKWGKSTFLSILADYMLMVDGEMAAQIWCLATIKTQAAIVYESAKAFLKTSEILTPSNNPNKHWKTKRDKDNTEMLLYPATNSYMKAGSKNSENQDGLNPHAAIIDEVHAIKDRNTYDVFSSAMGARAQPLLAIISTFGFFRDGIFDFILSRCQKVLSGKSKERLFPIIFRIDDEDDPADKNCWIKANPGLGDRPTLGYLEGEYQKAIEDPSMMPSFLAKHLNRASNASVSYFTLEMINACAADMSEVNYTDVYAVGGVDMAETTDLCCATAIIPKGGKLKIIQRYFIAEKRIEQNSKTDKMAYETFKCTGAQDPINKELLTICKGSTVRDEDVMEWFKMLKEKYDVTFWRIGYDRWGSKGWVDKMKLEGGFSEVTMRDNYLQGVLMPVAQGAKTLSMPMKETRALFKDKELIYSRHNGLFRWCTCNTCAKIDVNNNIQPDKARSRGRIDGYVSFLIAYVAYLTCKDMFEEYQP